MEGIKIGVQLYTLREHIQTLEDTDKTFKFIKDLGCDVVQISGIGPFSAQEKAELASKYSFDVCVTHTSFDRMMTDIDLVIDEHKILNCDCLGIGGMPFEARGSLESLRKFIDDSAKIASRMKERGCRFAYHNHAFEYEKIDGDKTIMDILLKETDPESFWFIPDVAWMQIAGKDPSEELKRMQGRVKVAHFKDYKNIDDEYTFTELGKGEVDFDKLYQTCKDINIPYIVYEQDSGFEDAKKSTEISFEFLKQLQKK